MVKKPRGIHNTTGCATGAWTVAAPLYASTTGCAQSALTVAAPGYEVEIFWSLPNQDFALTLKKFRPRKPSLFAHVPPRGRALGACAVDGASQVRRFAAIVLTTIRMADPQFEVLMRALMSQHNEERKAAEAQFEALIRTPMQAAPLMCGAMENSGDMTVRSMATVMFRKRVSEEFYGQLPPDMQVTRAPCSPLIVKPVPRVRARSDVYLRAC